MLASACPNGKLYNWVSLHPVEKSSSYREFKGNNRKYVNKQMDAEGMQLTNNVYRDGQRIRSAVTKK